MANRLKSHRLIVSSKIKALAWDDMKEFRSELLSKPHPTSLKKLEEAMIPPDGVQRKLDGVVGSVPPDEGCEVPDGELTDEELNPRENENADESGGGETLLKF